MGRTLHRGLSEKLYLSMGGRGKAKVGAVRESLTSYFGYASVSDYAATQELAVGVYMEFRKSARYALGERGKQLKGLLAVGALIPLLTFPISSYACSSVSCLNRGVELRPDFVVRILHGDKPPPGGSVWVSGGAQRNVNKLFSGVTAVDGTVPVVDLPPGEYWLNARLLGMVAGTECFHVDPRSTRKAKKKELAVWKRA